MPELFDSTRMTTRVNIPTWNNDAGRHSWNFQVHWTSRGGPRQTIVSIRNVCGSVCNGKGGYVVEVFVRAGNGMLEISWEESDDDIISDRN